MPRVGDLTHFGDGPDRPRLEHLADQMGVRDRVRFLGSVPEVQLPGLYRAATLYAGLSREANGQVEGFGLSLVEAQACGTPVIAFGRGGALETVNGLDTPAPTGVFFGEQTAESIRRAVDAFESNSGRILPAVCRANAERFGAGELEDHLARFRTILHAPSG